MRVCPECHATISRVIFTGWVLKVEGTIECDDMGRVQAVGPLRAVTTVKLGHELDAAMAMYQCPKCGHAGDPSTFRVVHVCTLSGQKADTEVVTPIGSIWVQQDLLDTARVVFADNAFQWTVPFAPEYIRDVMEVIAHV